MNHEPSPRSALLAEANDIITGDRNNVYGEPTQDFQRTAGVLNALGYRVNGNELAPHDVAIIISSVKLSRLMWSPGKRDNWVDLAGYAACGYECTETTSAPVSTPTVAEVPFETMPLKSMVDQANAGGQLLYAVYGLPSEFWTGEGAGTQLLQRPGFRRAYQHAMKAFGVSTQER
jgi:hypothetical protein